nr:hypothetical protein CFP56_21881 [Quercus suber]
MLRGQDIWEVEEKERKKRKNLVESRQWDHNNTDNGRKKQKLKEQQDQVLFIPIHTLHVSLLQVATAARQQLLLHPHKRIVERRWRAVSEPGIHLSRRSQRMQCAANARLCDGESCRSSDPGLFHCCDQTAVAGPQAGASPPSRTDLQLVVLEQSCEAQMPLAADPVSQPRWGQQAGLGA